MCVRIILYIISIKSIIKALCFSFHCVFTAFGYTFHAFLPLYFLLQFVVFVVLTWSCNLLYDQIKQMCRPPPFQYVFLDLLLLPVHCYLFPVLVFSRFSLNYIYLICRLFSIFYGFTFLPALLYIPPFFISLWWYYIWNCMRKLPWIILSTSNLKGVFWTFFLNFGRILNFYYYPFISKTRPIWNL